MAMYGLLALMTLLVFVGQVDTAQANDCRCQTVPALGKGNTSCSTSESAGTCTIDYNLFSPLADERSTQILRAAGLASVQQPPPGLPIQGLLEIAQRSPNQLADYVLVYLFVATADRAIDSNARFDDEARDVIRLTAPLRPQIQNVFGTEQAQQWLPVPDDRVRQGPNAPAASFADNQVTLAPGCIEVRTSRFWTMFKASWSPARIRPHCGS
jgi:hypothetical protein